MKVISKLKLVLSILVVVVASAVARPASAQVLPPPHRDAAWGAVSTVATVVGASTQLLMPRIYYSENEVTIGWKARWHVSVLASTMTLATLTYFNEYTLKPNITSYRPGCGKSNPGVEGCSTFGMPSTHAFAASAALGHGTAVLLVDSLKWSEGRVNAGAVIGDVAVPFVAAVLTGIGRSVNQPSYEHFDQVLVGAGAGLGFGLVTGAVYALMQRAECGYGAGLICW